MGLVSLLYNLANEVRKKRSKGVVFDNASRRSFTGGIPLSSQIKVLHLSTIEPPPLKPTPPPLLAPLLFVSGLWRLPPDFSKSSHVFLLFYGLWKF